MDARIPPVLRPERPPVRELTALAERFADRVIGDTRGIELTGVTLATADLRAGDVFVAVAGANQHGAQFARAAADAGAVAVITDAAGAAIAASSGVHIPVLVVAHPRAILGGVSAWVYGTGTSPAPGAHADAARDGAAASTDLLPMPLLLATTGTNGKTSVSHLLEGILQQVGAVTGLSSTAERHIGDHIVVSRLTTPEASEMHALLALMRERGVQAIAIEVSAQALSRHRVDGIVFDVAGFTNLSHDHLDDYADMREYFEAKAPLFQPDRARRGVVSLDTTSGFEIAAGAGIPVVTVGTPAIAQDAAAAATADWVVTISDEVQAYTEFTLSNVNGRALTTRVPVIGPHMAANASLAIVMMLEVGYEWDDIVSALSRDGGIRAYLPGRTERVSGKSGPAVFVDFGHSPDAFEKTLAAVRRVTPGKVLMLFGADGDRDASKRLDMGRTAVLGSDILVVTDHHPRFEDPASIRATLIEGARAARPDAVIYEYSPPEAAIAAAVMLVGEGDAILWAGPGHQDYRDIEGVRTPYSARELSRQALRDAGWDVPAT